MQMEEPTCLMRSFSQPSGSSLDFNKGDPARCLGESISFGRYMSEPLEWDKFSAFSSNRYLEEAAMYSKPGSVAKMKAYFEAYYKTIASRKRTANKASDSECRSVVQHSSCSDSETPLENDLASKKPRNEEDCNLESNSSFTAPTIPPEKEEEDSDRPIEIDSASEKPSNEEDCNSVSNSSFTAPTEVISMDYCDQLEAHCSDDLEISAQLDAEPSHELDDSIQLEIQPSNELEKSKCAPEVDLECRSVVQHSSCLHSDTPLENRSASENPRNEEDCNLESNSALTVSSKKMKKSNCAPEVESLKQSDHLVKFNSKMKKSLVSNTGSSACSKPPISSEIQQSKKGDDQERQNKKIKKLPDSNSRITSAYSKLSKIPTFSGRVVLSHPSNEGFATPREKHKAQDTVHKSIKFGPHADVNKNSSRTVLKSLTEYPLTPSAKIMKDKSTPLQTPNRASVARKSKHTSATPQPEIGRSQSTPGRSLSRGRARDPESQSPSLNNMKPSRPCGLKARATITFSPFNFRTEERAARRKEFFLKQQEKAQELEKPKQERVNTARKLLNTKGLKVKSATDSNTKSSKQETCTHPQPRPLKKRDTLRMKIGNENDSPNIL